MSSKGTAIVTGAAQGIGRGIALRLADDGYNIAVNDIPANQQNLDEVARLIVEKGRRALTVIGDVSAEEDVQELVRKTVDEFGGLDVMVANAGIPYHSSIAEVDVEKWDTQFAVNVKGTMLCYKHAAIQMIKQGRGGRIIGEILTNQIIAFDKIDAGCTIQAPLQLPANEASPSSGISSAEDPNDGIIPGMANGCAYAASKFAIRGLTQSAALDLGKYGITVNAYAPGAIDTTFLGKFDEYFTSLSGKERGSYLQECIARSSVGRLGTPEDVAALVSFLVSKEASFVNGQSMLVDGGSIFD